MSDLIGKWTVFTPGETPLFYSATTGEPLFDRSKRRAIAKVLDDMQGMYVSWEEMRQRGYTIEKVEAE